MNHTELFKHIKSGKLASVYLLSGSEEYVKNTAANALETAVLDGADSDFNLSVLDGSSSAEAIINALQTLPMMGGRRLIRIEDSAFLVSDAKNKSDDKKVRDAVQRVPKKGI